MPKISIIIPIYNVEKYLKRCLDSVASQTEPSFEVLMVDDGSADGSAGIAKQYETDDRFRYLYQENSGVSAARNNGMREAKGEWIAFIDGDDAITPEYLESLLKETDPATDIVCCGCKYQDGSSFTPIHFANGNCVFTDAVSGVLEYPVQSKKELYLELMDSQYKAAKTRKTAIGVPWGKLYRASLLRDNNLLFDLKLKRRQDNIFNMYAFEKARAIKYIDQPLYIYNIDHITNYESKFDRKSCEYYDLGCRLRYAFLSSRDFFKDADIYRFYCSEIAQFSYNMLQKFYLNADNPMSTQEKITAMRDRFTDELYQTALREKCVVYKNIIQRIELSMLIQQRYRMLILFDKMIRPIIKRLKH